MSVLLEHSPLGASGTHRWMECPGSVGLAYGVDDEEDDTFSKPGSAAHAVAENCLSRNKAAWQFIGLHYARVQGGPIGLVDPKAYKTIDPVAIDKEMADAVEVYLDAVRTRHPERHQGNTWVERRFHCPSIHPLFYGQSDLTHLVLRHLHVWDFKYGAGVIVMAERNPQLMYYACGVLEELGLWDDVDEVTLWIAQPRGYLEPIRSWTVSVGELITWLEDELVPAMNRAMVSRDTKSGEHCRFCPARYRACPQLMKDMGELETMLKQLEGKTADHLDNDQLSRLLKLIALGKIVGKAAEKTAFTRMSNGKAVPGFKLAKAKANREWKDGAEGAAKAEFGPKAYTAPELKSPAQIEGLPGGEAFCARWAFKPDKGLTLVPADDARAGVNTDTKSLFKPVARKKA